MDPNKGALEDPANEPSVGEGAFWHTNMDIYYGYQRGEVVEVEHEPDKYWLASIQYCYKHLVLLKWIGNYGTEFWVDTSTTGSTISTTSSSGAPSKPFGNPERLYALGHHLQAQLRSQFKLEKPSKILKRPTLYVPALDPYANIRTVDDLLVHVVEETDKEDEFATAAKSTIDPAGYALAKCRRTINYAKEDEDELEAALQSLLGMDQRTESPLEQAPAAAAGSGAGERASHEGRPLPHIKFSVGCESDDGDEQQQKKKKRKRKRKQEEEDEEEKGLKEESEVDKEEIEKNEVENEVDVEVQEENVQEVGVEKKEQVEQEQVEEEEEEEEEEETHDDKVYHDDDDRAGDGDDNGLDEADEEAEIEDKKLTPEREAQQKKPSRRRKSLELCKKIQHSAMTTGRYLGVDSSGLRQSDIVYPAKPKLLYDVGGANHERLFVRGTLLPVCHTIEDDSTGQLDMFLWIAIVVKNVGGRLTLRWFLCDEPKFKQGRLEMKSCVSKLVTEDVEQQQQQQQPLQTNNSGGGNVANNSNSNSNNNSDSDFSHGDSNKVIPLSLTSADRTTGAASADYLSAKALTFSMHFCNPRIHNISTGNALALDDVASGLDYKFPHEISSTLMRSHDQEFVANLKRSQIEYVFDSRRINLDRDRPLINHILTEIRSRAPVYLDLIFGPNDDLKSRREVLVSSPKMTKLVRATVKRELSPGVFEVHSEPLNGSDEIIKFIYPYDSSYTILPLEWSINNRDCLSVHPSRNPSPSANTSEQGDDEAKQRDDEDERMARNREPNSEHDDEPEKVSWCLRAQRSKFPRSDAPFAIPDIDIAECEETDGSADKLNPAWWSRKLRKLELSAPEFHCCLDPQLRESVESRFKVLDRLEIFHPTSDHIICSGRIRKVVFPMLWIQLSSDCYTLVPFDVTDIYPVGWCDSHKLKLVSLLPPRRRNTELDGAKKRPRKKAKISQRASDTRFISPEDITMDENFDLVNLEDRQAGIDYILKERSSYVKIFFNHKCFTGPSLSKSKICTLPQYVGPGPMRLVIEEVVTKLISVAYVPPRVLNDLSSKAFEDLLIERNLTNTMQVEFKAKYQKRVHREKVPVCLNPEEVALYCECVCEHIKCCYNLFGLNLYDGDFCPSNCRSLTKSNKFMKRATYYRDKARQGEVVLPPQNSNGDGGTPEDANKKDSNKRSAARTPEATETSFTRGATDSPAIGHAPPSPAPETLTPEMETNDTTRTTTTRANYNGRGSSDSNNSSNLSRSDGELDAEMIRRMSEWTIEDVARFMDERQLGIFKAYMKAEGIDGQALMLLDRTAIEEHFQNFEKKSEITQEDVNKLCDIVDWLSYIQDLLATNRLEGPTRSGRVTA